MKPWRKLASKSIVDDRWITLRADTCELPNGKIISRYYVLEEPEWVHVFAQDADGKILVVRQYRYAANVVCTELPGGVVNAWESALQAAKRELLEETGYVASSWVPVGKYYANPARQTNSIHLFIARGLRRQADKTLDVSEDIIESFAHPSEVKAMIVSGEFSQSLHIASFYMALDQV